LIDSRDSKKETEKESQTPVNQTSLASKFARVSFSTRQLKQTRQHLNLALQNDTLFSNIGRSFSAFPVLS